MRAGDDFTWRFHHNTAENHKSTITPAMRENRRVNRLEQTDPRRGDLLDRRWGGAFFE